MVALASSMPDLPRPRSMSTTQSCTGCRRSSESNASREQDRRTVSVPDSASSARMSSVLSGSSSIQPSLSTTTGWRRNSSSSASALRRSGLADRLPENVARSPRLETSGLAASACRSRARLARNARSRSRVIRHPRRSRSRTTPQTRSPRNSRGAIWPGNGGRSRA